MRMRWKLSKLMKRRLKQTFKTLLYIWLFLCLTLAFAYHLLSSSSYAIYADEDYEIDKWAETTNQWKTTQLPTSTSSTTARSSTPPSTTKQNTTMATSTHQITYSVPTTQIKFHTLGHLEAISKFPPLKFQQNSSNKIPTDQFEGGRKGSNQADSSGSLSLVVNRYGNYTNTLRNRSIAILIPTRYRPNLSYLKSTIDSLLWSMNHNESRVVILISINDEIIDDQSMNFIRKTASEIIDNFGEHVKKGSIEIISPPVDFYPDYSKIINLNGGDDEADTSERLKWRSKQTLDYAFMFSYAYKQQMADLVMLLEDDIKVTEANIIDTVLGFIESVEKTKQPKMSLWYEFCPWGAIGKVFPTKRLPLFVNFFTTFYFNEPVDW